MSEAPPEPAANDEIIEIPEAPSTGDEAVDQAVATLASAMSGSLDDQVNAYESAHRTLQDRLADVEG